jgi:uncharacterized protein YneF (UPF0154 family)
MNLWLAILFIAVAFVAGTLLGKWLARKQRRKQQALTPMLGVVLPPEKGN